MCCANPDENGFLSTPSGWRATPPAFGMSSESRISIHALRVEGDRLGWEDAARTLEFLSTPSGWRATAGSGVNSVDAFSISIHALRVEGDIYVSGENTFNGPISIHALRVEGDDEDHHPDRGRSISIHALRVEGDGRTCHVFVAQSVISIHALRVEGDLYGGAQIVAADRISIHALRVEGDSKNGQSFRLFLRKREKNLPL